MYKVITISNKNYAEYIEQIKVISPKLDLKDEYIYFISEDNQGILAYTIVKQVKKSYYLYDLYVKEEFRYHSYGSKMLAFITTYGIKNNVTKLYIDNIQEGAENFFIKNGFVYRNGIYLLDNIQSRKERTNEGLKGTWISIFINILLSILKITVGLYGKSRALIADGFHSISDVVGSIVILFCVYFGSLPEDEDHPYGHEKIESIAGNIVGTMLIITSFELIKNSCFALYRGDVNDLPSKITLSIAGFSIVVKYALYLYKNNIGKKTNNDAIKADAREHKSDSISSFGVLIGIILAIYINPIFDTILSIFVSLFIGREGIQIILETSNSLLDKQDRGFIEDIESYVRNHSSIGNVHDTLMRVSGDKIFLSFHVRLPKDMTVYEAHNYIDSLEFSLIEDFPRVKDVTIHIDYIH